jgi:hypothetical protein
VSCSAPDAHLAADQLASFAERISALTVPEVKICGTFTTQAENEGA